MRHCGDFPVAYHGAAALLALGLMAAPGVHAQTPSTADSETVQQQALSEAETEFDEAEEQGQVPLDESFGGLTEREKILAQRKRALRDTQFDVQLRSYYLDRQWFDDTQSEALAIGGHAGLQTGYFRQRLSFGATAYTSQRLYGPDDKGGTGLLAPVQQGYSVIGEVYGQYLLADGITLDVGRKGINTAFINEADTRMTPNTFQAAVLLGHLGGETDATEWRFGAGYFDKIKEKTSERFVSMATAAGAPDGVARGVYAAGAIVEHRVSSGELSFGVLDYYSPDILNIFYTEAKYTFPVRDSAFLQLAGQYIGQRSTGDDLQFGRAYSADQYGLKAELAYEDAVFTLSWINNPGTDPVQSPWGNIPSYNSVQVQDFNRVGSQSILLRAEYAFKTLPGLSAYALWVHGSQPEDPFEAAEDEYDFNLQWDAENGRIKGLSVRLRYALVTQDGGPDLQDFRLIVNYDPPSL
jgi:outer membrane porin, OprD family